MRDGRILRDGRVWIGRVEVAVSLWERLRGLLGRRSLGSDAALVIERCGSVHTVGMRFALDLVFMDRAWRVTRVVRGARPGRVMVWGGWRASRVLELESGWLGLSDLRDGDQLAFQAAED